MSTKEILDRAQEALRLVRALPETSQAYLAGRLDCAVEKEQERVGPGNRK